MLWLEEWCTYEYQMDEGIKLNMTDLTVHLFTNIGDIGEDGLFVSFFVDRGRGDGISF